MITKTTASDNLIEYPEDAPARLAHPKVITINEFSDYAASQFSVVFDSLISSAQPVILINLNSPGGSVFQLMAMRDLIKASPKPVLCFANGMAFSAGALLLTSCTKGYRWMSPSTKLMIHEVATSSEGKSSDIISDALQTEQMNLELLEILAENAGKHKKYFYNMIRKKNNADLFLTAEECKDLGLIDFVGIPKVELVIKPELVITNLSVPEKKKQVSQKASKAATK
jgi:ATP-dependent Clp endopeptidase proteolytic subunit ClpP